MAPVDLIQREPTLAEYISLVASVGFRQRDVRAIRIALAHSLFSVCAEKSSDGTDAGRSLQTVGMGRVIGDGGLHLYLTDIVVHPDHQRQGIGGRIVTALNEWIDALPYANTVVGIIPTKGSASLYMRHGYTPQKPDSPALYRWVNPAES